MQAPTSRRRSLLGVAAGVGGLGIVGGGASLLLRSQAADAYDNVVHDTWRPMQPAFADGGAARELVRCATLAANSHNTQPWQFRSVESGIEVTIDASRRCPAVDPDDHHMFVSLGCAVENLVQAAPTIGLQAMPAPVQDGAPLRIELASTRERQSELGAAIDHRQCARTDYDGRQVEPSELRSLEAAGRGPGVQILIFTDRPWLERFLPLLLAANAAQMRDAAFMSELKKWIRFSYADALATRDGLFAAASGSPVVPALLGRLLFDQAFTVAGESRKYQRQLRSSAGVAVFVADQADEAHWIEVGRCCQRFALQATRLGLKHAFLNQPVEVASLRGEFAALAGVPGRRPDLVMRFGYGPSLPRSLRRPIDLVLT